MADRPGFQKTQYAFAAHIRDPEHAAAPEGIEDRRMEIYRSLFFNNLSNLLAGMFPVLRKIHTASQWQAFIRQFMQQHRAETPYFLQLPREFLDFLQTEYVKQADDYPFLVELAHYEYVEIALSISEAQNDLTGIDPDGDVLENIPVRSELAWVYGYTWPVHRISADFLPDEPGSQNQFIALYRNSDDKVRFLELNPLTARLLELIEHNDSQATGETLLRGLAAEIDYPDTDALLEHGRQALEEMRQLEILTGTRTPAREV